MAFYVGNKGTWDEWRFFVKRITLIFCFRINRTIYPDLIRLSHLYFLSSFLCERDDLQKVKISLHDEHYTIVHTYTLTYIYTHHPWFWTMMLWTQRRFRCKEKTENVFALWWIGVWWVHHVQFIVYTITISWLETRVKNL